MNKIGQQSVEFTGDAVRIQDAAPPVADPDVKVEASRGGLDWANAIFVAGLLALSLPTLIFVAQSTWSGEQGSHGPIILATGLWLIWHERNSVRGLGQRPGAWKVIALLLIFGPLYLLSRVTQIVELEGYMMYSLLLVAVYGVVGYRVLRVLAFPLIYLFFAFPPPDTLIYTMTMPIKIAISSGAVGLLQLFGLPIGSTGVMIQIGQYQLLVAAACSGLNSIVSLSAITLFYIYLMHRGERRIQLILLLFVLPVAIAANFLRVLILILLTYYGGEAVAQGFLHDLAGVTMFGLALLLIMLVDRALVAGVLKKKSASTRELSHA